MGDALVPANKGFHGRVLFVDLAAKTHRVEAIDPGVYRQYLGGYGLGAWLMWKHSPAGTDALDPSACFAISSGLLTGMKTPFSGRIQIVGKSPLTGTWADSNSGGSVCSHLRAAGYDALVVTGRADIPTLLVIRDGEVSFEPAGELLSLSPRRDQWRGLRARGPGRSCGRVARRPRFGHEVHKHATGGRAARARNFQSTGTCSPVDLCLPDVINGVA